MNKYIQIHVFMLLGEVLEKSFFVRSFILRFNCYYQNMVWLLLISLTIKFKKFNYCEQCSYAKIVFLIILETKIFKMCCITRRTKGGKKENLNFI